MHHHMPTTAAVCMQPTVIFVQEHFRCITILPDRAAVCMQRTVRFAEVLVVHRAGVTLKRTHSCRKGMSAVMLSCLSTLIEPQSQIKYNITRVKLFQA